ncbi:hypothetical protein FHX42_003477 [Saccharopolyspora lacisalsi]|uniref:Uncharacterized protein n=1 Tax=Halosaccharopolyspora lacisalsi TaxID=1000566 RepID=A0A839E406_9PSEU|nr:hypothetical protein [Halosaccharopolyspora lacisalsi]MBA8826101.1 hypothetical protein [Halosaccharopolyspora lacisalsi]
MRVEPVDERDSAWEDSRPRFRVYLSEGGEASDARKCPRTTDTCDVVDADVLQVVSWAQDQAGDDELYAVALVGEDGPVPAGQRRGLTWLVGMDANEVVQDDAERQCFERTLARRGRRVVDIGQ